MSIKDEIAAFLYTGLDKKLRKFNFKRNLS